MAYDRFMIAPEGFTEGLQTNLRPWLIPDQAFEALNNCYVFRGRVRKRFGSYLMGGGNPLNSRLRILIDTTSNVGGAAGTVPGNVFEPGQMFSIGTEIYTVIGTGTPAALLDTGSTTIATYNTTTGVYVFAGAPANTSVYFYPATPVMGFAQYEGAAINNWPTYAFDTQFAYVFAGGAWNRSGSGAYPLWHGTDDDFFWSSNWTGITASSTVMFVSNFNSIDPMWYFDGTNWSQFSPLTTFLTAGNFVQTARIIIPFKNRLLLLNTIENSGPTNVGTTDAGTGNKTGNTPGGVPGNYFIIGTTTFTIVSSATGAQPLSVSSGGTGTGTYDIATGNWSFTGATPSTAILFYGLGTNTAYVNRCRYSHVGSPLSTNAWLEPNQSTGGQNADGGGFVDAATEEQIIGAEFIKDRLIVYFERSTWELAYTNNNSSPFLWQKINTELGSEATFSTVPFDKVILTIGNTGVHACSGANVERIDNKIPQKIFQINDKSEGVKRVSGIRDYFTEMVYWTFPSDNRSSTAKFPNKILVYNYQNGSWAFNDDSITTWGYFEQQDDVTWASTNWTWQSTNNSWVSGVTEANFRQVIAGNQEGFVFVISADTSRNAPSLQITDMIPAAGGDTTLEVYNHNLQAGDFVLIENAEGVTGVNDSIAQVESVTDANTIVVGVEIESGSYTGGGTLARVSNIQILSKQWNPYVNQGRNVYVAKIDFGVLKTELGEITVDYYPSATTLSMIQAGTATQSIMGDNILETRPYALVPLEDEQTRLWHPIYFQTEGECVQINMYFTYAQMVTPEISLEDFELEGMIIHCKSISTRLQ